MGRGSRENGAILETDGVTQKFGSLVAVDQVDFSIEKNETRSIIGPNGAGKTTFFNLITGVQKPVSGKIIFKGENITPLSAHERVKLGISRSFQQTNIFPDLSIRKNIDIASQSFLKKTSSPLEKPKREKINQRTEELMEKYEFQFERDLEEKAGILPHAGQRRLEIIMALAPDPDLLLLDEPTAGMTDEETQRTVDLLDNIVEPEAIILIEHDVEFVKEISDKITVLHQGRIIAEGSPEEISQNKKVQEAYLGGE